MLSVDKETLAVLRRLGLNQYESKTYLALTSTAAGTATELSDAASIPRPRVYDVLAKLEKRGFVVTKPGRPSRYAAVPVSTAIGALKRERVSELEKELKELDKLENHLAKNLESQEASSADEGDVFIISNRNNIYARLEELIKQSKGHILLSSDRDGLARKRGAYGPLLHLAQKRGVNVRIVEGPKRAAVVDKDAIIFLNDGKSAKDDKAAWIRSGFVSKAMREVL